MPPKKKVCENADSNPSCPYVTQINQITAQTTATNSIVVAASSATAAAMARIDLQGKDITTIKKALIGDQLDKTGGIVKRLDDIEAKLKGHLSGRDKALILTAFVTGLVAVVVEIIRSI